MAKFYQAVNMAPKYWSGFVFSLVRFSLFASSLCSLDKRVHQELVSQDTLPEIHYTMNTVELIVYLYVDLIIDKGVLRIKGNIQGKLTM